MITQKFNDFKLFTTMCMAVCYVFSLTVVCGHFAFNSQAFTD